MIFSTILWLFYATEKFLNCSHTLWWKNSERQSHFLSYSVKREKNVLCNATQYNGTDTLYNFQH